MRAYLGGAAEPADSHAIESSGDAAGPATPLPEPDQIDLAVEILKTVADPTRLRLLWALRAGEAPVLTLAEWLDKPQAAVSQHLAKLRLARLVTTRRQGAQVFYALANEHVAQLVTDSIQHAEHLGPGCPAHHDRPVRAARSAR